MGAPPGAMHSARMQSGPGTHGGRAPCRRGAPSARKGSDERGAATRRGARQRHDQLRRAAARECRGAVRSLHRRRSDRLRAGGGVRGGLSRECKCRGPSTRVGRGGTSTCAARRTRPGLASSSSPPRHHDVRRAGDLEHLHVLHAPRQSVGPGAYPRALTARARGGGPPACRCWGPSGRDARHPQGRPMGPPHAATSRRCRAASLRDMPLSCAFAPTRARPPAIAVHPVREAVP